LRPGCGLIRTRDLPSGSDPSYYPHHFAITFYITPDGKYHGKAPACQEVRVTTEEIPGALFYACGDPEELVHRHPDDAIEAYLDDIEDFPEMIELYGHAPLVPNVDSLARGALDQLLEVLDDEFGDPSETSRATPPRLEAARQFVATILKGYSVRMCHAVGSRKIKAADWVAEHRPDWRTSGSGS